jgi:hypothetical protein
MWKKYYINGQASDDNIKWRMRIACCIPKPRDTHSEHVTLIAFPLQQWVHGRSLSITIYIHRLPLFQYIRSYLVRHATVTKEQLNKEFSSHSFQSKCLEEFPHVPRIRRLKVFSLPLQKKRWQNLTLKLKNSKTLNVFNLVVHKTVQFTE